MKLSSGLRTFMAGTGSLKSGMDGSVIRLYNGTPPTSADQAVPAASQLLCEVSVDGTGTGITFDASTAVGTLLKQPNERWLGTVVAGGQATWFRVVSPADADGASTAAVRLQGTVAYAGSDLQITDPNLTANAEQKIDYFSLVIPSE